MNYSHDKDGRFAPLNFARRMAYRARRNRKVQWLMFVPLAAFALTFFSSVGYYQFGWRLPEVKGYDNSIIVTKETEEEALERRTEEILFENLDAYYQDAHKKALAEKVEALKVKIASTTELTPEDTDELKAKLKRADRSLR